MFSRRGGYGGRSKATPTTTCQKCLQKGHYSYECTVAAQERPYKPRPSRTQQLLNPSLKPKLTEEVPSDLLRKKGLADKILAEREEECRKKSGRRSRSLSAASDSDSVSTISTNRSPSRSRSPKRIEDGKASLRGGDMSGKRRRRSISSESQHSVDGTERFTRRRLSSMSPEQRGRRRSRTSPMDISHDEGPQRKAPRKHYSRSPSNTRGRGGRQSHSRDRRAHGKRASRMLSPSRSPSQSSNRMDTSDERTDARNGHRYPSPLGRPVRRSQSKSRSPYRRRSPSPYSKRRMSRSPSPYKNGGRRMNHNGPRGGGGGGNRFEVNGRGAEPARPPPAPAPARERSLSPYSKRVALTRQMHTGH